MHSSVVPPQTDTHRFLPARFIIVCLAISIVWGGWLVFQYRAVPHIIRKIYLGEATPAYLNTLIKGQAKHSVDYYLLWWKKESTIVSIIMFIVSVASLTMATPCACSRYASWQRIFLAYCRRERLVWDTRDPSPLLQTQDPPISRLRMNILATFVALFALIELASVITFDEWYPFTPGSMYSKRFKNTFQRYEVYGLQQNQLVLIADLTNDLSERLQKLTRQPEQLRNYLCNLGRQYQEKYREHRLQAVQLRQVTWKLEPYGTLDNSMVNSQLICEVIDFPSSNAIARPVVNDETRR